MDDALHEEIITEINAAFADVARGSITLHEADVLDGGDPDSERAAARARDTEGHWQQVPAAAIEAHPSILSFLCPESFRYYLAAYMVWSLLHYRTSGSLSSDFTIYALTPNTNKPLKPWKLARFSVFSPAQARSICRYLQFMAEHGDGHADSWQARVALDSYWTAHAPAV